MMGAKNKEAADVALAASQIAQGTGGTNLEKYPRRTAGSLFSALVTHTALILNDSAIGCRCFDASLQTHTLHLESAVSNASPVRDSPSASPTTSFTQFSYSVESNHSFPRYAATHLAVVFSQPLDFFGKIRRDRRT